MGGWTGEMCFYNAAVDFKVDLFVFLLVEYKVESISALKATRQPWQQDPQLNESSSEEEEDEEVPKDDEEQSSTVAQTKE